MRERLTRVETVVGVNDASGGMRSDIREIKTNIGTLFDRIAASEKRFALMVGGGVVVIWVLERIWR